MLIFVYFYSLGILVEASTITRIFMEFAILVKDTIKMDMFGAQGDLYCIWHYLKVYHKPEQMIFICLCWGFTAQSTQWGNVERSQFT